MKLVTMFAELDGEKRINFERYNTRLLALARYTGFSSTSTVEFDNITILISKPHVSSANSHQHANIIFLLICNFFYYKV